MEKHSILIAEDDADDRFLLQTAFREKGFSEKIDFVENGVALMEYLASIESQPPAGRKFPGFILLDLNMPKKDGRSALKEIKEHALFRNIPVIIFTTTKNETEVLRCYELGANTYVVKPVSFEALLQVVEEIRTYWFKTAVLPRN